MNKNTYGSQSIGCCVTSCAYNENGSECRLSHIEVEPCRGCRAHTGKAEDESNCGSYKAR